MVSIFAESVSVSQTVTLQNGEDLGDLVPLVNFQPFGAPANLPDFAYIEEAIIELNFNPGVDAGHSSTSFNRNLAFDFGYEYYFNSIKIANLVTEFSREFSNGIRTFTGFSGSKSDFYFGAPGQFVPVFREGDNDLNSRYYVDGTQTFDVEVKVTFIGRLP